MSTTTRRGQRTREEILAAATEVVIERGPDSFSLREVARRSGLAPSALYNHFPNRDAIVVATAMRALGELREYLGKAPAEGNAAQRLRALARSYLEFARERPREYRLIFECLENPPTTWEGYLGVAEPFTLIVSACVDGLASGEFVDPTDVGAGGMAYGMWALCHGHASLTSRNLVRVRGDFERMTEATIDALLGGWSASTVGSRQ